MQILLYSGFRKRENSTKTPLVADATRTVTGYLREPCSIMNPVFKIERFPSDASPQSYTYAYIGEFARWYFVKDWSWADGVWQCSLEVDVLASFKTDIGNSQAYIERCAYEYDGAITDKWYPATTNFDTERIALASSWNGVAPSGGCYVLGVICNANRTTSQIGGAVTYFVLTPAQMRSLMGYLLGTGFLDDNGFTTIMTASQQLTQDTAKALVNPMQYIASCMWLPVPASVISDGHDHPIVLGYYDLDSNVAVGQDLSAVVFTMNVTGQIPVHPQAATRGKYLNYAPYTRLTLNVPPFGSIPLDTSFCEIGSYLKGTVWCDPITGKATMRIELYPDSAHVGTGALVREVSTMMGVPIQLAQMTPDYINAIGSALSLATTMDSAWRGDIGDGAFANRSYGAIGSAIDSLMPQVESQGVSGSFLATVMPPQLTAQFFVVTDEDNTEFGRPLCAIRTINTIPGFIKCRDAHVDFSCYKDEKTRILNYMTSGFFWE